MNLEKFCSQFPDWRTVSEKDNQRILDYYDTMTMQGGTINLRHKKDPDYFRFNNYESVQHHTFINENADNKVEGLLVLTIRPCYINGRREQVGYFSDLRFVNSKLRKSKFQWKDFADKVLSEGMAIDEFNGCRHYLGSYIATNKIAIKAIKDKSPWSVSDVVSHQVVNILGRKPRKFIARCIPQKSGLKVTVSQADKNDLQQVMEFLDRQNKVKAFGYVFSGKDNELERRLRVWDDFSISSFYVAKNELGKIIGCTALWDPSKGRRIIVDKYPAYLEFLGKGLNLFGKKSLKRGCELKIIYLTHREIEHGLTPEDKNIVLNKLLDAVYESKIHREYHSIAFADYFKDSMMQGVENNYVVLKTQINIYQLHNQGTPDVLNEDRLEYPAGHEVALI
jgi:hypothetical protein